MASESFILAAFFSAIAFALVHLFSHRIYRYSQRHRIKMLSFFGGITVAYVFLDLLPRLETTSVHLQLLFGDIPAFLDVLAMPGLSFAGFMIYFILEHFAIYSRKGKHKKVGGEFEDVSASTYAFAVHFVSLAFVSLLLGYILRFEAELGILGLIVYTLALSLHFIILDNSMEKHYKRLYVRFGRFFAGLMPLLGWGISVFFPENSSWGYLSLALVFGIILFNAIKDEVPRGAGKESRLFIVGALMYSALLLAVAWLSG
jgi:hypothetical protein